MVVQEKKVKGEIRIYVDLRKLNDVCLHDPFHTPFTDEALENVGGQEVVMPMKYIVLSLRIAVVTYMADPSMMKERMS